MSKPKPLRILFMTPFGGKTGSEMLLWNLLHHYDRERFQAAVYCEQSGGLKDELPPDVPYFVSPFNASKSQKVWAKIRNGLGQPVLEEYLAKITRSFQADCWYLNTIYMAWLAPIAKKLGIPVVAHVHELSHILYQDVTAEHLAIMLDSAKLVIGNAEIVNEELRILGVKNPHLLYPFVEVSILKPTPARSRELRHKLGIADTDFVWTMAGTPIYRKGVDLIPAISRLLPPKTHFVWIGGVRKPNGSYLLVQKMLAHEGRKNAHFVGVQPTDDYVAYMGAADGFLLTSREEAFGMVNVEAAYLGKPIVAFNAGGNSEILTEGMGIIVENGNLPALVDAMKQVMSGEYPFDPVAARARADYFNVATLIDEWHRIMSTF